MTLDELLQPFITWLAYCAGHFSEVLTVTVLILQVIYITYGIIERQRRAIRAAHKDAHYNKYDRRKVKHNKNRKGRKT